MGSVSNIFIYKGQETNPLCAEAAKQSLYRSIPDAQRRIIEIEDPSLLGSSRCLGQRNLLVIPGGTACKMAENHYFTSLSEKIQAAVKADTVSYLGICAGSYLGPWLGLTPSKCYKPKDSSFLVPPEIQAVPISCVSTGETFHVVRAGGGYYKEIDPSETPVAYYQSSEEIAILRPRENVVLSNVHPEFQLNIPYVREHLQIDEDVAKKLLADLTHQQKLFVDILKLLGVDATQQNPTESESEKVQFLTCRILTLGKTQTPSGLQNFYARAITSNHPSNNSPLEHLFKTRINP